MSDEPVMAEGDGPRERLAQAGWGQVRPLLTRFEHNEYDTAKMDVLAVEAVDRVLATPEVAAALARPALPEGMTAERLREIAHLLYDAGWDGSSLSVLRWADAFDSAAAAPRLPRTRWT